MNWQSKVFKVTILNFYRPRADGYIVGTVTVAIPKHMVSSQSGPFHYNYVAYHEDGKNSRTIEYFHSTFGGRDLTEKGYKRPLSIPLKHSSKGDSIYIFIMGYFKKTLNCIRI